MVPSSSELTRHLCTVAKATSLKLSQRPGHLIGSTIILVLLSDSTGLNPLRANILHSWPLFAVSACSSPDRTRKQLLLLPQGPSPIHCSHHINTKLPTCLFTYVDKNNIRPANRPATTCRTPSLPHIARLLSRSNLQPALTTKCWVAIIPHNLS